MDFNNKEEVFDFIEKLCNLNLSKFELKTGNEKEQVLLFKLSYLFVRENGGILTFDNSFDGVIEFMAWVINRLYTKNDPLYIFSEIFYVKEINQNFIDLYKEFYDLMGGRDMDKMKYEIILSSVMCRYHEYRLGTLNEYLRIH